MLHQWWPVHHCQWLNQKFREQWLIRFCCAMVSPLWSSTNSDSNYSMYFLINRNIFQIFLWGNWLYFNSAEARTFNPTNSYHHQRAYNLGRLFESSFWHRERKHNSFRCLFLTSWKIQNYQKNSKSGITVFLRIQKIQFNIAGTPGSSQVSTVVISREPITAESATTSDHQSDCAYAHQYVAW